MLALLGAAVQGAVLWATDWPLGIPSEWVWARTTTMPDWWLNFIAPLVVGLLLSGLVVSIGGAAQRTDRIPPGSVPMLLVLGFFWLLSCVAAAPSITGMARSPFVLYYERTSGYFWQAKYEAADLSKYLQTYHERIREPGNPQNYLHQGTHPPGLIIALRGILSACEASPALTNLILITRPPSVHEAFTILSQNEARSGRKLTDADAATLWLSTLLVAGVSVIGALGVFSLAQRQAGLAAAWWSAAFWLVVPASAVFLPKSDVMFGGITAIVLAHWLRALDDRAAFSGAFVGALMFLAVNLSLAFVPVGVILLTWFATRRDCWSTGAGWKPLISSGLVFVILWLACWWYLDLNLLPIWLTNLANHAEFYSHFTRTWWKWLLENPLELSFALGFPIALLSGIGIWRSAMLSPRRWELLIPWCVWGLLWLSGKNRGEAARLWILLMPLAAWVAAVTIERLLDDYKGRRCVWIMFLAQMILAAATASRVDGFHFSDFQQP